jgi:IS5 family transposase
MVYKKCNDNPYFLFKTLHFLPENMYRKRYTKQLTIDDFFLPFGGKLRSDNRWVILADMIPWDLVESFYAEHFSQSKTGPSAKPARLALGALIIKERLGVSDEEAVEQIKENPYLQYFLGFRKFQDEAPFDPSMYVHFRKRFSLEQLSQINETIAKAEQRSKSNDSEDNHSTDDQNPPSCSNKGKLVVDATCAPADIRYPTDTSLVNEAREKSEDILDILFKPLKGSQRKPRTYRQKARRLYVSYSKNRKHSSRQRRKLLRQQLGFLGRNLKTIAKLAERVPLSLLDRHHYRNLLVIHELYRQQHWMYENRSHRVSDRIVSISQPHVRPIVRGKASASTEFGAKLSASLVDGFMFLDHLDWNSFNESGDLIDQIEAYRQRFGCYPESVHCDKIYRTRDNRKFCKNHSIRISGPPLGRPAKVTTENAAELKARKLQQRQDELDRIPIEGKFGQGKRRFGLNRIMAKLSKTSETAMAIIFIVMNLEKWLKLSFFVLFFGLTCLITTVRTELFSCLVGKNGYRMLST